MIDYKYFIELVCYN